MSPHLKDNLHLRWPEAPDAEDLLGKSIEHILSIPHSVAILRFFFILITALNFHGISINSVYVTCLTQGFVRKTPTAGTL